MTRIDHWLTDLLEFEIWEDDEGEAELRVRPRDDSPAGWAALNRLIEKQTGIKVDVPGELRTH